MFVFYIAIVTRRSTHIKFQDDHKCQIDQHYYEVHKMKEVAQEHAEGPVAEVEATHT
jgi:hypothetical protein